MSRREPSPRRRFGQHFLSDPRILARIADELGIKPTDTVVEIGPGRGALTAELVGRAKRVIAIEIDRDLVAMLRERYREQSSVTIVEADVLSCDLRALVRDRPWLLAGNIPYNITTPILFKSLEAPRPERTVFLVQREVAERVAAAPGSREYGALSVNLQAVARAEVLFRVNAGSFVPPPKVDSAVLRLTPLAVPLVSAAEEAPLRALVVAAFGMRRKQLHRVMRSLWRLDAATATALLLRAGLEAQVRPETLSPADFARLLRAR